MATNTYTALDKVTIGTATPSITFSNIPLTYKDLVIVGNWGQSLDAESCLFRVGNSSVDTGTNYSATELYGTGSASGSQRTTNATGARITFATGGGSAITSNFQLNLMNYSNTTTNKVFLTRYGVPSSSYPGTGVFVSQWRSTAAINTITIYLTGGNILAGSTFSLYGIVADLGLTPKATGGVVTSDATYYYHTFANSGTFTPLQSLTADILAIGGGGSGGGIYVGGGGGSGGAVYSTGASLTAQNYAITIGAGGTAPGNSTDGSVSGNNTTFSNTITANGGGGGGHFSNVAAKNGGSGGGSGQSTNYGSATQGSGSIGTVTVYGFRGGAGSTNASGGGGGIGAVGSDQSGGVTGGFGGIGLNTWSTWATATNTGISGGYGGGGSGCNQNGYGARASVGYGGGAQGQSGYPGTGGGGGGTREAGTKGSGGSGIVIVRYTK